MTTKPTNADDRGAGKAGNEDSGSAVSQRTVVRTSSSPRPERPTDRAAGLAAKPLSYDMECVANLAEYLEGSPIKLSAVKEWIIRVKALETEASRPAQDIVAEMREKVEALKKEYHKATKEIINHEPIADARSFGQGRIFGKSEAFAEVLAILSPTKNTAPTEAEES